MTFALMLFLAGSITAARRAAPPAPVCLQFAPGILVDVTTGRDAPDRRPKPALDPYQPSYVYSPGRQYRANLRVPVSSAPTTYALTIFPEQGDPVTVQDGMTNRIDYAWASRGARLAYYWMNHEGGTFLGIAEFSVDRPLRLVQKRSIPTPALVVRMQWSPNGDFLLFDTGNSLNLWSASDNSTTRFEVAGLFQYSAWSADGARLAYMTVNPTAAWLTLVDLVAPDKPRTTFSLDSIASSVEFNWSPDSRFVALQSTVNWPFFQIGIFGINGWSKSDVAEVALRGDSLSQPLTVWTKDSKSLIYLTRQSGGTATSDDNWNLVAYHLSTNQYEPIAANIIKRPFYAPGSNFQRLAITAPGALPGKRRVTMLNVDGTNPIVLTDNVDDSGDPNWSSDGKYVAVVWARGAGSARKVYLTWARSDGTGLTTLDDGFWDVRDLRWPRGGEWPADSLVYVTTRGDASGRSVFGIETVDLASGEIRRLADGFAQITGFYQNQNTGAFDFWWRSIEGEIGIDSYSAGGARQYRYRAAAGTQVSIEGLIWQNNMVIVKQPGGPWAFPSPTGDRAALKLGPLHAESLHLAWADDSLPPRLLVKDLYGLGDPLWSPDGRYLAVTQALARSTPVTLSIFRADGRLIRALNRRDSIYAGLKWTDCD